ncbi:MAG: S-layer homology domain-containing protein [Bacillota bacterium]|nr:S-layer homology domain-containing protein [Bacillota bacterium]MDD3850723.1 S-layer homology domain-containing protein [Bacillota bacterium]
MTPAKRTSIIFMITLLIISSGVTALAYNPFIPGYGGGGFPDSGPEVHLSADSADFILTGKKTGAQLRNNIDFTDIRGHWARDYVFRMAAQSVVRGYGSRRFSPEGSISRQEALAMLVRIMGREAEVQRRTASGGTLPAGSGIFDLWAQEYIAVAEETGIVGISEGGSWQQRATRQEVAVWFARALRLNPVYGTEQQYIYNLRDWQGISVPNQPLVEAILREDIMRGDDRGYFNPGSGLRRSEIAVMLDKVADRFYSLRGLNARNGRVVQKGTLDGAPALCLQNTDGTRSVITLSGDTDFPVLRNGRVGTGDSLQAGDLADYVYDAEGVLYAFVPEGGAVDAAAATMEGYIRAVDPLGGRLSITDYDGNVHTYRYADSTGVTINSRPAGINDLKFGLEVTLAVRGDLVAAVQSNYLPEQPGYIPPSGRVRTGRVAAIGDGSLVLDLDSGGREEFSISYGTIITKEGAAIPAGSIKTGDRAKVYTDTILSNTASRINIEGMQQLIQDVYRGTLEAVHPSGGTLVLKDASVFTNGDWEDRERRITLELEPGMQVYYGGRSVAPSEVQSGYLNTIAYVAVSENFGNRRAVKVVLKRGAEQFYGGRIDGISWGTGEIELKDRNNIMLNNSSIILSGGRMVDISALDEDHTVTVVADRYGGINNAAVVMLEDAQLTGDGIFVGRLNEIRTREFDINYYSGLEQNEWGRIGGRNRDLTFEYDRDTYIIEFTSSGTVVLDVKDFFQGDYADRRSSKSSRDYYAFVVADDDRARAIRITEGSVTRDGHAIENDDLEEMRITTGEVDEIDTTYRILTINKSSNWSSFYGEWERADSENHVNYAGALILKDGRPIDAKQLRKGEGVYIIRDDVRGIIILSI